jgi:DegV family protein with EDD domain
MGTGFVALAAARLAADGADLDAVEQEAFSASGRGRGYVVVHRLDNLRRSGRIGRGASWLSSALAIKPLLLIDPDGRLVLAQRVRTAGKALEAMVEQVVADVGDKPTVIAVHHIRNLHAANEVANELTARLHPNEPPTVTDMGPVLGVHIGAGAVAVCVDIAD